MMMMTEAEQTELALVRKLWGRKLQACSGGSGRETASSDEGGETCKLQACWRERRLCAVRIDEGGELFS